MVKSLENTSQDKNKIKKIFFLAGEHSGDLQGSIVIRHLKKIMPDIEITGVGGKLMKEAGMTCIHSSDEMAVIGIIEVIKNFKCLKHIKSDIQNWLSANRPDMVVLIDYPDFNKLIATYAKSIGLHVLYYITPQVWAWRSGRVKDFVQVIDEAVVFFPFEVDIWSKAGTTVNWFGHPLVGKAVPSASKEEIRKKFGVTGEQVIGILPGSRTQEIDYILPEILTAADIILKKYPKAEFLLPLASTIEESHVRSYLNLHPNLKVKIIRDKAYDVMEASDVCIVTSGTATLETAIIGTPMVVVYRTNWITSILTKYFIESEYIALPNVIANKRIVPELIRENFKANNTAYAAIEILEDKNVQARIREELKKVKESLGEPGAGERVAEHIANRLKELKKK